ncbi:MAG: TonB-dependent receptor [Bacteroidia bacterium]|nr:TonB-dependent receptor [Bacteroidia bacterium]
MKNLHLFCIIFLLSTTSFAQVADSSFALPEVSIVETIRSSELENELWNSESSKLNPTGDLAKLLSQKGVAFIKSYGLGSLATSSIRGGNANHTLVLWNGLPIQSPMLGQLDLSLLPLNSVDAIGFEKGGNSALWGSGAIGGVISLNPSIHFNKKLSASYLSSKGSWGQAQHQGYLKVGNDRVQSQTKFLFKKAENDFFYEPVPGVEARQQSNAALRQGNFFQDLSLRLKSGQIGLHYWHQNSYREIPPTNVQNSSQAYQEDLSQRLMIDMEVKKGNLLIGSKAAIFNENLNYFDPQILLESPSNFRTYLGEFNLDINGLRAHQFMLGTTWRSTQAWSKGYQESPSESRQSVFGSWKWEGDKLEAQANIRQQWIDFKPVPITPQIQLDFSPVPVFHIKLKASRNYRLPTLNDRYWVPGGNPDLRAESGYSQELSLSFNKADAAIFSKISLTAFNRNIKDWILWGIQPGENFWSANNLAEVWSRGLEFRYNKKAMFGKIQMELNAGYDLTYSTNQVGLYLPRIPEGSQLFYTPRHQGFATLDWNMNSFSLGFRYNHVGQTGGILISEIPAYHIGNLNGAYEFSSKSIEALAFFEVNNLWNQQYFVIERRPMPGINYQLGLKFTFTKKN